MVAISLPLTELFKDTQLAGVGQQLSPGKQRHWFADAEVTPIRLERPIWTIRALLKDAKRRNLMGTEDFMIQQT